MANRIIKFRFWNSSVAVEKMLTWEFAKQIHADELFEQKHLIPLQFTGLLDKNGKEIYEGDIVQVKTWNNKQGNIYKKGQVCWADAHFFVAANDPLSPFAMTYPHHPQISWEIIGNIYENPEFLKAVH